MPNAKVVTRPPSPFLMPSSRIALTSSGLTTTRAASTTTRITKATSRRACGLANAAIRRSVRPVSFWSTTERSVRSDRIAAPMGCMPLMHVPPSHKDSSSSAQLPEPPQLGLALEQSLSVEIGVHCRLQQCLGLADGALGVGEDRLCQVCSCRVQVGRRYDGRREPELPCLVGQDVTCGGADLQRP